MALIGAVGALRLEPDAGTDPLVDDDSAAFRATEDFKQRFGDDAVVVLVQGDLEQLVLTADLGTLLSLEGCLSGNVEGGKVFSDEPAPGPLRRARRASSRRRWCSAGDLPQPVAIQAGELLSEQTEAAQRAGARRQRGRRARPRARGSATSRARPPARPPRPR